MRDQITEAHAALIHASDNLARLRTEAARAELELNRASAAHDQARNRGDVSEARNTRSQAFRAYFEARSAERAAEEAVRQARIAAYYADQAARPKEPRPSAGVGRKDLIDLLVQQDGVDRNIAERMSIEDLRTHCDRTMRRGTSERRLSDL